MDCDHEWETIDEEEGTYRTEVCMICNAYRCSDYVNDKVAISLPDDDERVDFQYGYPPKGTDPRDFTPDYELCSKDEIAAWEEDKAKVAEGKDGSAPAPGGWVTPTMHMLAPRWGIGVYKVNFTD